jgi:predicted GTPase
MKRYRIGIGGGHGEPTELLPVEDPNGEWVRIEDVKSDMNLSQRIAELEKVVEAAKPIVAKCKLGNSNTWGLDALAENDIEHLYDALSALTPPSRQAPLDNSKEKP